MPSDANAVTTVRTYLHDQQMWIDKPLAGPAVEAGGQTWPSQWHVDAYIAGLHREIEGCDHTLDHLEDPAPPSFGEPPTAERLARRRAEIESEKAGALAELERLGALEDPPVKVKKTRGAAA